jgi:hypothetical protein
MKYCIECKAPVCQKCEETHNLDRKGVHSQSSKEAAAQNGESSMKYHNIKQIDEMMHDMVQSFIKHYLEIEERRTKNKELLQHRDALYKKETMQTFQKL